LKQCAENALREKVGGGEAKYSRRKLEVLSSLVNWGREIEKKGGKFQKHFDRWTSKEWGSEIKNLLGSWSPIKGGDVGSST